MIFLNIIHILKHINTQHNMESKESETIDDNIILNIIDNMKNYKLKMDKISNDPYHFRHLAFFWYGI